MTEAALTHTTVLLNEAVDELLQASAGADGTYVDATFGRGGHSRLILSRLSAQGRLQAFDKDPEAIAEAGRMADSRFSIRHEGFSHLGELPPGSVDGVLMDLGISSPQIDSPERGFSFRFEGPLDMRMDTTRGESVADWLATATVDQITEVIRDYGEERFAFQIAKAIVARRAVHPISSTRQLAEVVAHAVKTREKGKDPATRTFQAIRIYINKELEELEVALEAALEKLGPQGRLAVISFHSLEDRIVKRFMASKANAPQPDRRLPIRAADLPQPVLKLLAKMKPSDAEVAANPRARSAIMRVAERTSVSLSSKP